MRLPFDFNIQGSPSCEVCGSVPTSYLSIVVGEDTLTLSLCDECLDMESIDFILRYIGLKAKHERKQLAKRRNRFAVSFLKGRNVATPFHKRNRESYGRRKRR